MYIAATALARGALLCGCSLLQQQ